MAENGEKINQLADIAIKPKPKTSFLGSLFGSAKKKIPKDRIAYGKYYESEQAEGRTPQTWAKWSQN